MAPSALEADNVSLVGHTDLEGKPGFKIAIKEVDGRWLLYLATFYYSGWWVIDVTDPSAPEHVRFIEGPENTMTKQMQVAEDLMITSLEKPHEGYGPHGASMDPSAPYEEGAYIFDLSDDPADPELVGHYETGGSGTHRNFYGGGDYAYMCAQPEVFEKTQPRRNFMLTVVDISDPSSPDEVARWWWPGQAATDDEPADKSFYFHGPAYVEGDRAHLSYGRIGAVTLDVTNPEAPEYVCRMPLGDGMGSWLGIHSFVPIPGTELGAINSEVNVEVSPLEEGGQALNFGAIIDMSDERDPEFRDSLEGIGYKTVSMLPVPEPEPHLPYESYYDKAGRFGPHNQHHPRGEETRLQSSELLFTAYFNAGLRIFDISDPLMPAEAGYFVPEDPDTEIGSRLSTGPVSHFEDVLVDSRGYIYCTDPNHGLFILESDLL